MTPDVDVLRDHSDRLAAHGIGAGQDATTGDAGWWDDAIPPPDEPPDDPYDREPSADDEHSQPDELGLDERVNALIAEMLTSDQLDDIPPLRPVVAGFLFEDTLARINGASGHGKTFVALDLAGCVGTGTPWHGHDVTCGEVVYLVAEGGRGIRKRVRAWEQHHGKTMTGVRFLPRPVQATAPEWVVLTEACRRIQPRLIVVDTQARITVGVDESSNTEMGVVVDHLERMRRATGACVALVHHLGLSGDHGRGATAVRGALQTELTVVRNQGAVTVSSTKQKDDEEAEPVRLTLQPIKVGTDDNDFPITSPVLVLNDGQRAAPAPAESSTDLMASFVDVLRDVFSTGTKGGTKAEIKSVIVTERALMGKSSFYRAWNDLVGKGQLVPGERGVWFFLDPEANDAE